MPVCEQTTKSLIRVILFNNKRDKTYLFLSFLNLKIGLICAFLERFENGFSELNVEWIHAGYLGVLSSFTVKGNLKVFANC